MKKTIIAVTFVTIIFAFGGCSMLDNTLVPSEGQIKSDSVIMVDAMAQGLIATGNPYAVPALAGSTIFAIVAGAYTNMRKKQKLAEAGDKAEQAKIVTESIIAAIEESAAIQVGDHTTIGDFVKGKVEENLKDKDIYLIGKAIISALKKEGE